MADDVPLDDVVGIDPLEVVGVWDTASVVDVGIAVLELEPSTVAELDVARRRRRSQANPRPVYPASHWQL